jgi:hypothetical protein
MPGKKFIVLCLQERATMKNIFSKILMEFFRGTKMVGHCLKFDGLCWQ